jgi:hypothetical protein
VKVGLSVRGSVGVSVLVAVGEAFGAFVGAFFVGAFVGAITVGAFAGESVSGRFLLMFRRRRSWPSSVDVVVVGLAC